MGVSHVDSEEGGCPNSGGRSPIRTNSFGKKARIWRGEEGTTVSLISRRVLNSQHMVRRKRGTLIHGGGSLLREGKTVQLKGESSHQRGNPNSTGEEVVSVPLCGRRGGGGERIQMEKSSGTYRGGRGRDLHDSCK